MDLVKAAGLDVSEHGMWGYPEFYIPVPGGWNQSLQHLQHAGMAGEAEPETEPVVQPPVVPEAEPEAA